MSRNKELRAAQLEAFFLRYGTCIPQAERMEFIEALTGLCSTFATTGVEDFIEKFKAEGDRLIGPVS